MKVICYGDSNTYGYDPRSYIGSRYLKDSHWVDLFAAKTGWDVENAGMNGRGIPRRPIYIPDNTDLLIVMLGTNDLLSGENPESVSAHMETYLNGLNIEKNKILLIAPPPMTLGDWVPAKRLVDASVQLAKCYQALAKRIGVGYADAGEWNVSLTFDGVHFAENGHKAFAEGLCKALN